MSTLVDAVSPNLCARNPELPMCESPLRAELGNASKPLDSDEVWQMLFRSECFAEDLMDWHPSH